MKDADGGFQQRIGFVVEQRFDHPHMTVSSRHVQRTLRVLHSHHKQRLIQLATNPAGHVGPYNALMFDQIIYAANSHTYYYYYYYYFLAHQHKACRQLKIKQEMKHYYYY